MTDYISREAAIDVLEERLQANGCSNVALVSELNRSIGYLRQLPAVQRCVDCENFGKTQLLIPQPEQRWIPCSERLPEDYEDVLVWFEYFRYGNYNCLYQMYGIGSYSSGYNSWLINQETGWNELKVFAWMPLPKPPKEEDE